MYKMLKYLKYLKINLVFTISISMVLLTSCNDSTVEHPNPSTITGVIKDTLGESVAGALVKVRGIDTGISYMVVSQDYGRYRTPKLLSGRYTVDAFGGNYQSIPEVAVDVGSVQQEYADRVLSIIREITPPKAKFSNEDYAQLMPAGKAKSLITSRCALCHGLDRVVPARKSPQSWQLTVDRMNFFLEERKDLGGPLSNQEQESILGYVSKYFTRDAPDIPDAEPPGGTRISLDPNGHLPRKLLKDIEAKFVTMEFDPQTPINKPETEIGVDSKGNAWISEGGTTFFGRFDPISLSYIRIESPIGKFPRLLAQIAVDPQDQVWIIDNGSSPNSELLRYNHQSKEFKTYKISAPLRYRAPLNTLRFLDGNVWGTGNASSRVVKLNSSTGEVTAYPSTRGSHPFGIVIGSDKMVWYVTNYNNEIIKLDPNTGRQTSYKTTNPRSGLRRIGADALGNLWAGAQDSNTLVKLDSKTGEITEYPIPTRDSGPYSVDVDTMQNFIWVSERDADKIARFDPRTNSFIEFPLPTAGIEARRILVDPVNPNRIWWNCSNGCIGYTELID